MNFNKLGAWLTILGCAVMITVIVELFFTLVFPKHDVVIKQDTIRLGDTTNEYLGCWSDKMKTDTTNYRKVGLVGDSTWFSNDSVIGTSGEVHVTQGGGVLQNTTIGKVLKSDGYWEKPRKHKKKQPARINFTRIMAISPLIVTYISDSQIIISIDTTNR
jgi:hypothetical protein